MTNIIGIMVDSLRQDHVSFYNRGQPVFEGIRSCQTPNIDAFAQECVVFDNAYPEGLPTIPVRTQLFTGQHTMPFRPWQPLTKEDISAAEILRSEGYVCGMVSDCYHYRAPGMNFHRGFNTYRWIRGQECDPWTSHPTRRNIDDYVNANYDSIWRGRVGQFLSNTDEFAGEEDWFAAQVVDEAIEWLRNNRCHRNIFAWIDSFDPHEPWDPPVRFDKYTDPAYRGKRLIMPMGGLAKQWATPEEIRHIQGLYAGEVACVDHSLGRLFQALKELGYYDDSIILLLADHGHPLADHGKFLKGTDRLYSELLKVPFMIRWPGGRGARRTGAIVQFHDVLPTLLDAAGMTNQTMGMQGRSFQSVLRGDSDAHREAVIIATSYSIGGPHSDLGLCIRDNTWSYVPRPESEPRKLFNLSRDPRELTNVIDQYPEEARRLSKAFGSYFWLKWIKEETKGGQGKVEMASGAVS